jgi:hypothetical protein
MCCDNRFQTVEVLYAAHLQKPQDIDLHNFADYFFVEAMAEEYQYDLLEKIKKLDGAFSKSTYDDAVMLREALELELSYIVDRLEQNKALDVILIGN